MISGVEACQGRLLWFHPKLSDGLFFSLSWEQRGVENEWITALKKGALS
jgi:hypothetical protein